MSIFLVLPDRSTWISKFAVYCPKFYFEWILHLRSSDSRRGKDKRQISNMFSAFKGLQFNREIIRHSATMLVHDSSTLEGESLSNQKDLKRMDSRGGHRIHRHKSLNTQNVWSEWAKWIPAGTGVGRRGRTAAMCIWGGGFFFSLWWSGERTGRKVQ